LYEESERDETDNIGVKRAAKRRMKFELGYDLKDENELNFVGKILYEAPYDNNWGEKEMDYILILKIVLSKAQLKINDDEMSNHEWVSRDKMKEFVESKQKAGEKITPWFELIVKHRLSAWWDLVEEIEPYGNIKFEKKEAAASEAIMSFI